MSVTEQSMISLAECLFAWSSDMSDLFFRQELIDELNRFTQEQSIVCSMTVFADSEYVQNNNIALFLESQIEGKSLNTSNLVYYTVIGQRRRNLLAFYKSFSSVEETISQEDIAYCENVCRLILAAFGAYRKNKKEHSVLAAMDNAMQMNDAGFVVFDSDEEPVSYHGLSGDILHSLTGCIHKKDAFRMLMNTIRRDGIKENELLTAHIQGYNCTVLKSEKESGLGFSIQFPHKAEEQEKDRTPNLYPLTAREKEVVRCLAEGYSYQEIAGELFISVSTVRNHVTNIYRKLNIDNQRQLIALYYGRKPD